MNTFPPSFQIYAPDGRPIPHALSRTTHLGVGAHQDDLEIMAFHGIAQCHLSKTEWFTGITCTDGAQSPRGGLFARTSNAKMTTLRNQEQKRAARIGKYSAVAQLGFSSSTIKKGIHSSLQNNLIALLELTKPEVIYTHNLADRHDTHVSVALHLISALRQLSPHQRPTRVLGCEVWRSLDWLPDHLRIALDVSGHEKLAKRLLSVFQSQIAGGKKYDIATLGRWRANATYLHPRSIDHGTEIIFAMDLTPLLSPKVDIMKFMDRHVSHFKSELTSLLQKQIR